MTLSVALKVDRSDKPRDEKRVRLQVRVRPRQHVLCGQVLQGYEETLGDDGQPVLTRIDCEMTVYESDVRSILEQVEDETEAIERIKARIEQRKEDFLRKSPKDQDGNRIRKPSDFRDNWYGAFYDEFERGPRPLISAKVIEKGLPSPVEEARKNQDYSTIEHLAAMLGDKLLDRMAPKANSTAKQK